MGAFSDADVGKRVVAQDGGTVGTVVEVRNGDLYVEPAGELDPDLAAELDWGGAVHHHSYRLEPQFVTHVSESVVRLRV